MECYSFSIFILLMKTIGVRFHYQPKTEGSCSYEQDERDRHGDPSDRHPVLRLIGPEQGRGAAPFTDSRINSGYCRLVYPIENRRR
ncbi:hypothetical protein D3C73_1394820 [compost metagenome]